ncbi:lysozyme C, intestinal isozyme-like [Pholidichthys leucotaenia]
MAANCLIINTFGLCITSKVSKYNTTVITHTSDGLKYYGIFQVKGGVWCDDDGSKKQYVGCSISCDDILSDVKVAIKCAQTVASEQGLKAWGIWVSDCRGRDLSSYTEGCGV